MSANDILAAIRRKYPTNAIVPELTIRAFDAWEATEAGAKPVFERRIDALMFESLERTAIEIKVSRADFKREHSGKWGPWARVSHRFVYAVPEGLVTPAEVWSLARMSTAGLWYVKDSGQITVAKRCTINKHPEPLPNHVIQTLAYRATPERAR